MQKTSTHGWDLPSAIFLFLAILFSAWHLQSTGWTEGLEHVRNVALLGMVIGLALGQSNFQRRGVALLSIGYMLVIFCWQWLGFIEFTKDVTELGDKLLILIGRLFLGLSEFASNRPVKDPLFFVALLCIPYWLSGLFSGFQLTRHANSLAAVLPSGFLMFITYINHYTARDYSWLFGIYLFASLLLLGRQKYLEDRKKWKAQRVQISAESGMDFNNTIMVSSAVLILLVWVVPATLPTVPQMRKAWQRISKDWFAQDERFENMFASVKKDALPSTDIYRNILPLGTGISESEAVAFLVYAPAAASDFPRLYWRGRVYDQFEEGSWSTSSVEGKNYEAQDGDFSVSDISNRENLNFTFNVFNKGQTILYTAAQPIWVSHPANIIHTKIPGAEEDEPFLDIVTLQAAPYLEAGETYHANSMLANPSIAELRQASTEYPAWVTDKYLQLPADFSARIEVLALQITAAEESPYDKAAAITIYLRSEIEYSSSVSFPDETVDRLEYFLLKSKKGFCNYYASAEVLMLRAAGVPARLAVGYAQGKPNLENTFYTVRERDAHAWPEVYFPGYGWIEFEPTGNQEPVQRPLELQETSITAPNQNLNVPEQEALLEDELQAPTLLEQPQQTLTRQQIFQISLVAGGFIFALLGVFLKRRYAPNIKTAVVLKSIVERNGWESPAWLNKWIRWTTLTSIEKYFNSVNTSLRWMGKPQPPHVTAAERAVILQEILPSAADSIQSLLNEHQSALFSRRMGNVQISRRAARNIIYQTINAGLKRFILGYN